MNKEAAENMREFGKLSIWHWAILLLSFGFVGFLGRGLCAAISEHGIGSGEAAGWVQAIGTVLAIVGAFVVVDHQYRKERALELDRQRMSDVRKLKAIKAVLVQICEITTVLHEWVKNATAGNVYDFDPRLLADYKPILQALPLFEIPSPQLVLQITVLPRGIEEVVVRLVQAREQENDPVQRLEWLLANDIEARTKALASLAIDANNRCVDEITALDGYTPEELRESLA